jgi:serine/threonine protein kinase/WD40 repeat protein
MSEQPQRIGRYEVISELGRGAMGTVYKARDPVLDRLVALKTMSEALLVEEEMQERFYREARSAAGLQHVNIVTVFDLGEVDGAPFIAMELLDGAALSTLMYQGRPSRLDEKVGLVVQICRGLDFAHKKGIYHRDIKPGNIQVLLDGTAKILDFGIAWREDTTHKTKTGLVMGTPNYISPEQIIGAPVDHRADMWSVGVILYELISGARPFDASTIPSLIYRVVHQPLTPLDARAIGVPEKLVGVIDRALSKDPNGRYRDLAEMADALQRSLGTPVSERLISEEARESGFRRNLELGKNLFSKGEPHRALEAARRAQVLEPTKDEVLDLIGEIESYLASSAASPTLVSPGPTEEQVRPDMEKWIDEARLELTAGNRTEALRIVSDVLEVEPGFAPAIELRELLDKPAAPGRYRTGQIRTYTQGEIRIRRASSFQKHITFGDKVGPQVITVAPREHLVAAGGSDGSVRLWDLSTRSKVTTLRSGMHRRAGHEGLVTSLVFSRDGAFLATGHLDGAIHVWSLDTGDELKVRLGHDSSVGGLEFSPDGTLLASGGMDANLKLWRMEQLRLGEPERRLIRQPAGVTSLSFVRDGTHIVTGHANRILRVQDVAKGRLTSTLRGHQAAISTLTVAPDGNLIASGGQDRMVRLFDLQKRSEVCCLEGHKKAVSSIAFFPIGQQVVSVAMEDHLVIWDPVKRSPAFTLWGEPGESFAGVKVFDNGQQIVCALADGRIRIWVAS